MADKHSLRVSLPLFVCICLLAYIEHSHAFNYSTRLPLPPWRECIHSPSQQCTRVYLDICRARVYGHIPNMPPGTTFRSRCAAPLPVPAFSITAQFPRSVLCRAGVHGQQQAGIHGDSSENGGAFSICLSQGYEDNQDKGDTMYVT